MVLQVQQSSHNLQCLKNWGVKYICIWRNVLGLCYLKTVITSVSALQGFRMSSWQQFWLPSQICVAKSLNWRLITFVLLAIPRCCSMPSGRYGMRSPLGTCLLHQLPGFREETCNSEGASWLLILVLLPDLQAVFYLLLSQWSEWQTEGAVSDHRNSSGYCREALWVKRSKTSTPAQKAVSHYFSYCKLAFSTSN